MEEKKEVTALILKIVTLKKKTVITVKKEKYS